jgi:hypothetical protein
MTRVGQSPSLRLLVFSDAKDVLERVLDKTHGNIMALKALLGTRRVRRPRTSTPTGTSISSQTPCAEILDAEVER